eukprot:Platyproteum_vivax@DN6821_c0_g2_i1.p2
MTLDESLMADDDFQVAAGAVMSPPIRQHQVDGVALQQALVHDILSLVGTDHAVFNSTQKAQGRHDFRKIPNGVNGLEERLAVVWDSMVHCGKITPMRFVSITSTTAAKIFNIYPKKGCIRKGSDADIAVLDPHKEFHISAATHHSRLDTNVFEGRKGHGSVVLTLSRGAVVWRDGAVSATAGHGRYVRTEPFSPYVYPPQHA